jgi:hypothetical protein
MHARVQRSVECVIRYWISIHQSNTTQETKFGCTDTNFKIDALISTWRLSVDDFERMNNESYIRITLSNLAALLERVNLIVWFIGKSRRVVCSLWLTRAAVRSVDGDDPISVQETKNLFFCFECNRRTLVYTTTVVYIVLHAWVY